jgi:formate dehydrogenase subunit beta
MIKTNGDPLATIRRLLVSIWKEAQLDGMMIPRFEPSSLGVVPFMAITPEQVARADPCAPLQIKNAARRVADLARELPTGRYAAVLRPCEGRALDGICERSSLKMDDWLLIGVDCLACFPRKEFAWRLEKAGGVDPISQEALHFARQGGITPYRYRRACQECSAPGWEGAALSIELLGLPVRRWLHVRVQEGVNSLDLSGIADGQADPVMVAGRQRVLDEVIARRSSARLHTGFNLPAGVPATVDELIAWLDNCAPCQECLLACPIYVDEMALARQGELSRIDAVKRWLAACSSCGLCEEACPKGFPMSAVIHRLEDELIGHLALA